MAIIKKPSDHAYFPSQGKIGVLLVNLGTPDGTDYWSMRKYLKQFLMDKRVVDIFRPLWWLILNGPILTFRPSKSGKAYEKIWDKNNYGSPLRRHTTHTHVCAVYCQPAILHLSDSTNLEHTPMCER